MNIAKLVRRRGATHGDGGIPSTRDLLEDPHSEFLRELTFPKHPEVDLVAVHGLNWANAPAFAVKTWTGGEKGQERMWLKDFLPHRLPNVRVLLYSYNSNVAFHTSKIGVGDIAEDLLHKLWTKRQNAPDRPLIFVCHSLGGLVVKRAVVKARIIPRYASISRSARSFAFFATPHQGGLGAEFGQTAAGLVRRIGMSPRTGIMEALRKDSHVTPDINSDFVDGQDNYRICSFYECQPMPPLNSLVVEKSSAVLGLGPVETRVPCSNANHSTICKFAVEDENYRFMIDEIEALVDWSVQVNESLFNREQRSDSGSRSTSTSSHVNSFSSDLGQSVVDRGLFLPPVRDDDLLAFPTSDNSWSSSTSSERRVRRGPFFLVPNSMNPSFVGQQGILHHLKKFTKPSSDTVSLQKMALYGLGGVGKSQIALAHAYWHQLNYPEQSVFWVQAHNAEQLYGALELISAHCRISQLEDSRATTLDRLRRWFQDEDNGRWLMIVDSVDNVNVLSSPPEDMRRRQSLSGSRIPLAEILNYYIPTCTHGRTLFTANNKIAAVTVAGQAQVVEVGTMGRQDACALLRKEISSIDGADSALKTLWLNEDLEDLSEHLGHLPLALVQAAAFIRKNAMSVNEYLNLIKNDDLSLKGLLSHTSQQQPHGRADDCSQAVISTWKIGYDQIGSQCKKAADLLALISFYDEQNIPQNLFKHFQRDGKQSLSEAFDTLLAYSFIWTGSDVDTFGMHRLVRLAVREWLVTCNTEQEKAIEALNLLSEHFPSGEYGSWDACAGLTPHALKILKSGLYGSNEAVQLGILQSKLSWYYSQRGLFDEAESWSRQALENMAFAPNAKQVDVLNIKSKRSVVLHKLGRIEEAEDTAQEVWRQRRNILGSKHEDTVRSLTYLCLIYQEQGRYIEGEVSIRKILKSLTRTLDPEDPQIYAAKIRLAAILRYLGKYDEAELSMREVILAYDKAYGPHHPETLRANFILGLICYGQGKYVEAERLDLRTWDLRKDILGPDHPDTIKSQYAYSNNLQAQFKFAAAESLKRDIYRKARYLVGPKHTYTFTAAASLASCLVASHLHASQPTSSQLQEAETLYQLALDGEEQRVRADHPIVLAARTDLTLVKLLRGQPISSELEASERETLKKLRTSLGKDHSVTINSQECLSRILWSNKNDKTKGKEAIKLAKKVLSLREKKLGWSEEPTWRAGELVVDMLPEGKERTELSQKVIWRKRAAASKATSAAITDNQYSKSEDE